MTCTTSGRRQGEIVAVVVTYGRRAQLVEQTLGALRSQPPVSAIVLVDNGTPADVAGRLDAIVAGAAGTISLVRHETNRGSAGGYHAGLAAAARSDAAFAWTLDDDTTPVQGAAQALLDAWTAQASNPATRALLSQRWPLDRYRREREWNVNAAFGVDLWQRLVGRPSDDGREQGDVGAAGEVAVRMAPWSGLFFPLSSLEATGLPDERFVLYEDDHDFTLRLTAGGGRILVVPESRLETLDESWLDRPSPFLVSPWLAGDDAVRAYFGARNRVHLERTRLVTNPARHAVNLAAFVLRVALLGRGRIRTIRWFLAGIADGWRGRLGDRRLRLHETPPSSVTG